MCRGSLADSYHYQGIIGVLSVYNFYFRIGETKVAFLSYAYYAIIRLFS